MTIRARVQPRSLSGLAGEAVGNAQKRRELLKRQVQATPQSFGTKFQTTFALPPKAVLDEQRFKTLRSGTLTVGPPVSRQDSLTLRSPPSPASSQPTYTLPLLLESAPYSAALVASSCKHKVNISDFLAGSAALGPSITARPGPHGSNGI